jgi:nitroreductase
VQDEEDLLATASATYVLLLAAHARGLVGYWRTPGVLRDDAGLAALGIPPEERFVALVHLGWQRQDKEAPERAPVGEIVEYLS